LDRQEQDVDDAEFHAAAHKTYRAARSYVDASLRDAGYKPASVRVDYPGAYAMAIRRALAALRLS
jgi:L-fucose isomerase-like protein